MGRVWVLDTETKGTGAEMVPLERARPKPGRSLRPEFVAPQRPREPKAPEPRAKRRFRIVEVVSRAVLADDVGAREALAVLAGVRSSVDVRVSVWEPKADRWRLLTLDEQRLLWSRRQAPAQGS